jgi:RND family efflux transporter MFP subunit
MATTLTVFVSPDNVFGQGMPPTLVVTDTVTSMEFHEQVTLVGRSEGAATSAIVAEVEGQVEAIVALEGNPIKKGETLITIDDERKRLELLGKEGEFIEAREQFDLAKRNLARTEELFEKNLSREISLDSAKAWVKIAEGRLQKLTAERDRMARDFDDCKVKAPFTGYTSRRLVNVGEWVDIGTPVYEMVDISRLRVVVDLPERYYGRLSAGNPATIYGSADTTAPLAGMVTGVTRSANAETHTYPVIITVENADGKLGGGALVRALLSFDQKFSSTAVPKDAVVRQGPQTMIYTIQEGKAAPVSVNVSATVGDMVAIAGPGISPGMQVIVRGNERVFPGAPVRTADSPPPGQGTSPDTTGQAAH